MSNSPPSKPVRHSWSLEKACRKLKESIHVLNYCVEISEQTKKLLAGDMIRKIANENQVMFPKEDDGSNKPEWKIAMERFRDLGETAFDEAGLTAVFTLPKIRWSQEATKHLQKIRVDPSVAKTEKTQPTKKLRELKPTAQMQEMTKGADQREIVTSAPSQATHPKGTKTTNAHITKLRTEQVLRIDRFPPIFLATTRP